MSGAEYDDAGKTEYEGIRQKSVPTIERRGLAAVSSSFFAALCSAFGRYDVVHIHAEGPAFFCWIPKLFGKRVISTRMCRSKDLYSLSVNRQKSKNRTLFSTTAEFWWRRRFTDLTVRL